MEIVVDDPTRAAVRDLLEQHLADMYATSPAESVHALEPTALAARSVLFFTAMEDGAVLGCGALKELSSTEGEIKSMRTSTAARRRGVGSLLLQRLVEVASGRQYAAVFLETGSQDFFAPARQLYAKFGFVECGPFDDYSADPNSVFMMLDLSSSG